MNSKTWVKFDLNEITHLINPNRNQEKINIWNYFLTGIKYSKNQDLSFEPTKLFCKEDLN